MYSYNIPVERYPTLIRLHHCYPVFSRECDRYHYLIWSHLFYMYILSYMSDQFTFSFSRFLLHLFYEVVYNISFRFYSLFMPMKFLCFFPFYCFTVKSLTINSRDFYCAFLHNPHFMVLLRFQIYTEV